MANPILIPFRAEHLLAIASRNPFDDRLIDSAYQKETKGPAFTAIYEEKVLACAGMTIEWPGVGHAWTVFGHDFTRHALWITRTVKAALRDVIRGCNLHRVEAQVLETQHRERKWLELFGFEIESIAREYTSSRESVARYEWLRYRMHVRELRKSDFPEFMEVVCACDLKHATQPSAFFLNDNVTLVMTEDYRIVAYAIHTYANLEHGPTAIGVNIGVLQTHRGRGLAEKLHHARLALATKDGANFFVGLVHGSNPPLEALFKRCGAKPPFVESSLGTMYISRLQ